MGRDAGGLYMIGSDGSLMRSGPRGKIMIGGSGATLRSPPRRRG
jgi:hypothetical protein